MPIYTYACFCILMNQLIDLIALDFVLAWRRKWQPTPVFLPGESQGQRSLVGCCLWVAQSQTWLKRLSSSSLCISYFTELLFKSEIYTGISPWVLTLKNWHVLLGFFCFCFGLAMQHVGFPDGSDGKESACSAGDPVSIPGLGRSLEKEMAPYSSVLAWRSPWTEEPGRLGSIGSQRVRHDWVTNTHAHEEPLFPDQGSNLYPLWWKHSVLTTGLLGKSLC